MTTKSGDYQQQLLLALRVQNVSGPRIAEALAEVDSHVAETGEDAYQAFGEPRAYAEQIAAALGVREPMSLRSIFRSVTWQDGVLLVAVLAGSGLVFLGIGDLVTGVLRWRSGAAVVAGLALLAATVTWIVRRAKADADPVLDPRTGRSMAPAWPKWTILWWLLFPVALLLLAYLSGAVGR